MSAELFKIYGTIGINNEEAKKKLKETTTQAQKVAENMGKGFSKIGDTFNNIGESLSKVGRTASVVTGAIAGVMAASFTKAKAFIGTYESAMTVFTRKLEGGEVAAGKMYDSLVEIAKGSAFSQEYLVSAGQTLVAMGLDADTTSKYVQAATDAISGMGGSGAQVQEMATLFAKVSQQTNLYTQDIQQMVERGIPAWDILATKYGTTTDKVKEMASDGLIPATESLNTITGALEETNEQSEYFEYSVAGLASELKSGTLTGSMDSLNSSFRTFALTLLDLDPRTESGKENISKLNNIIATFGETMEKVGSRFSFVGEWIGTTLSKINDYLTTFNETLDKIPQETLEDIAKVVLGIAAAGPMLLVAGKAFSVLGSVFSGIGSTISTLSTWFSSLSTAISTASAACGGLAPFLGIVAAVIAAVVGVIIVLKDNWDKVVETFQNFIQNTGLAEKFESIKETAGKLWEKIQGLKDLFVVIGTTVLTVLQPAIAVIAGLFNGVVTALDPLMVAIGGLVDILAGLGELIVGVFTGDWTKAQEALDKIWQGICDLFGGLWDTVKGLLQGFWDGFIGWFTSLGEALNLGEWFSNLSTTISTWFTDIWNNIVTWFTNIPTNVSTWLTNIWTSITIWFTELGPQLITWLETIWTSITTWFTTAWQSAVNFVIVTIPQWIQGIFDWFNQLPYQIGYIIGLAIGKIIQWGIDLWNFATTEIPKFVNGIIDWIKELPGKFWTWLTETVNKIVTWGTDIIEKAKTYAKDFIDKAIDFIKELPSKVWDWLSKTIDKIVSWGTDMVEKAKSYAQDFIDKAINFIKELPTKVSKWLTDTVNKVVTWGSDMVQKGKQAALDLFNAVVDKVKEIPGKMLSIGSDIVSGIWNGINGSVTWITNKVKEFAKGILDGIKSALGIHSPSRVMRDEVGKNMALGVVEGWNKELDGIQKELGTTLSVAATDPKLYDLNVNHAFSNSTNSGVYGIELLEKILMYLQAVMPELYNRQLILDTGAIAGALTPAINKNLGTISASMARGRSY